MKYYKGLGTSTAAEAKEYFRNIDAHLKDFVSESAERDSEAINLAFHKKKADERKHWLENYDCQEIDYGAK